MNSGTRRSRRPDDGKGVKGVKGVKAAAFDSFGPFYPSTHCIVSPPANDHQTVLRVAQGKLTLALRYSPTSHFPPALRFAPFFLCSAPQIPNSTTWVLARSQHP